MHIPLFDIDFEDRARRSEKLISFLVNVVTFDIVPPDTFIVPVLDPPEYEEEYIEEHSFAVGAGYEYLHTINSLNITFVFLVAIIALSIIIWLVNLKRRKHRLLLTVIYKITDALYWNVYIRYVIEGALEICVSAFVNSQFWLVYEVNPFKEQGSLRFKILNTLTTVFLLFIVLISPFFFLCFFIRNKKKWCFKEDLNIITSVAPND